MEALYDKLGKSMKAIKGYFQRCADTPFLCRENRMGWVANLDFLLGPSKYENVISGKYDDDWRDTEGGMEPVLSILEELKEKHPRLAQTMKLSRSVRTCRGSYDWLLPEELERHMAEIVRIEDRRELCRDCTGDCRQNPKGYYDVVSPTSSGLYYSVLVLCEHERARQERRLGIISRQKPTGRP